MKKIFTIIGSALLFAACSNDELETKKDVVVTDTSSMYNSNASTDIGAREEAVEPAPVRTITRTVYVTRNAPARRVTVREATPAQPDYTPASVPNTNPQPTGTATQGTGTGSGTGTVGTGTGTEGTTTTTKPAEKKEGMSNATKGAVIGGVGGAVGGAILSKKKGKGAIIGGVIGAAGGYILGRKKDKQQEEAANYN